MSGMKINRHSKSHLWLFLFVVSCFLFTANAGAQSDPSTLSSKETIVTPDYFPSLVSETNAEAMLLAEIAVLENLLSQLTPNSPAYLLAERKLLLFTHTWENLTQGDQVEEALTSAYGEFAINSDGNSMNSDELPGMATGGPDYGDPAFDALVTFLGN